VASEKRLPTQPDAPTFKELGIDLVGGAYRGLAVPKSTPENVRKQVSDMLGKINKDPEFVKKMQDAGFVLADISYEQMGKFMQEKKAEYGALAKKLGIGQKK
jgi:tripartite-type tricarboxylate transporter receptor subunit TctC